MALPSARRPVAAVEDHEEIKREELKVCLKKDEWFLKAMDEWCKYLSEKNRATLTRKIFLRRATFEAFKLNFDMTKLPNTWMRTILDAHEMTLFKRIKKYTTLGTDKFDDPSSSDSDVEWKAYKKKVKTSSGPPKKKARPTLKAKRKRSTASTSTTGEQASSSQSQPQPQQEGRDSNGNPYKKYVDLSNEPPPGWWLQAYSSGKGPKRELRLFSTEDQNIVFYDYTQDEEEEDSGKYVRRPHDRDNVNVNFDWWAKQTKEKEAKKTGAAPGSATQAGLS